MKAFTKWSGIVVSIVVLILAGLYFGFLLPMQKRLQSDKVEIPKVVAAYNGCIDKGDVSKCTSLVSSVFTEHMPVATWQMGAESIRNVLGKRMTSELVEGSVREWFARGIKVNFRKVSAAFRVMYENDPLAKEQYTFVFDEQAGVYKIESYHIDSSLLHK